MSTQIKVSELGTADIPLSGNETVLLNQNNNTKTTPLSNIKAYANSDIGGLSSYAPLSSLSSYAPLASLSSYAPLNSLSSYAPLSSLGLYAPLSSAALSGIPTAPTAVIGTNNNQIATTAYTVSAVNLSAILTQLQGFTANPLKIGPEYIPSPKKTPYYHISGMASVVALSTTGSILKQAGASRTWVELGRVLLPWYKLVDGWVFSIDLSIKTVALSVLSITTRQGALVPAIYWDVVPQSTYFGASPSNAKFSAVLVEPLIFRLGVSNSFSCSSRVRRSHIISYGNSQFALSAATNGFYQNGYDYTAGLPFTDATVIGQTAYTQLSGVDVEYVLIANGSLASLSADYREIYYDLTIDALSS